MAIKKPHAKSLLCAIQWFSVCEMSAGRSVLLGFLLAVGALLVGGLGAGLTVLVVLALVLHHLSLLLALLAFTFLALVLHHLGLLFALVASAFFAFVLHASSLFALLAFTFLALMLHHLGILLTLVAGAFFAFMLQSPFVVVVSFRLRRRRRPPEDVEKEFTPNASVRQIL